MSNSASGGGLLSSISGITYAGNITTTGNISVNSSWTTPTIPIDISEVKQDYVVTAKYEDMDEPVYYDLKQWVKHSSTLKDIYYWFAHNCNIASRDGWCYPSNKLKCFKIEEAFDHILDKLDSK